MRRMHPGEVQLTFTVNAHRIGLGDYVIYLITYALIPTFASKLPVWNDCMHSSSLNLGNAVVVCSLCASSYHFVCRLTSSNGGTCIPGSEHQLCDCTTAMKDGFKYGKFRRVVYLFCRFAQTSTRLILFLGAKRGKVLRIQSFDGGRTRFIRV